MLLRRYDITPLHPPPALCHCHQPRQRYRFEGHSTRTTLARRWCTCSGSAPTALRFYPPKLEVVGRRLGGDRPGISGDDQSRCSGDGRRPRGGFPPFSWWASSEPQSCASQGQIGTVAVVTQIHLVVVMSPIVARDPLLGMAFRLYRPYAAGGATARVMGLAMSTTYDGAAVGRWWAHTGLPFARAVKVTKRQNAPRGAPPPVLDLVLRSTHGAFQAPNQARRLACSTRVPRLTWGFVAHPAGFEPATVGLEVRCSIH